LLVFEPFSFGLGAQEKAMESISGLALRQRKRKPDHRGEDSMGRRVHH
jgi:hypothetical protein